MYITIVVFSNWFYLFSAPYLTYVKQCYRMLQALSSIIDLLPQIPCLFRIYTVFGVDLVHNYFSIVFVTRWVSKHYFIPPRSLVCYMLDFLQHSRASSKQIHWLFKCEVLEIKCTAKKLKNKDIFHKFLFKLRIVQNM